LEENKNMQERLSRAWNEIMGSSERRRIREVWKKMKDKKGELPKEDEKLAKVLLEHKEYESIWETTPPNPGVKIEGVNPYLHIYLHLAIENQLAEENPRQVSRYVSKRIAEGEDRHKVIHEITVVFSESLLDSLKYRRPLDRIRYIQKLEELIG